jgi:hypothetical protein
MSMQSFLGSFSLTRGSDLKLIGRRQIADRFKTRRSILNKHPQARGLGADIYGEPGTWKEKVPYDLPSLTAAAGDS